MPHLTPSSLGHLQDDDYRLAFYCEGPHCRRTLSLDLNECIRRWGRDVEYVGWKPPIRCIECGSKNISVRLTPGPYEEQLRRAAELEGR